MSFWPTPPPSSYSPAPPGEVRQPPQYTASLQDDGEEGTDGTPPRADPPRGAGLWAMPGARGRGGSQLVGMGEGLGVGAVGWESVMVAMERPWKGADVCVLACGGGGGGSSQFSPSTFSIAGPPVPRPSLSPWGIRSRGPRAAGGLPRCFSCESHVEPTPTLSHSQPCVHQTCAKPPIAHPRGQVCWRGGG